MAMIGDNEAAERRTSARHWLSTPVVCLLTGPELAGDVSAVLLNISTRGARLYLRRPLEPGAVANLEVTDPAPGRRPIPLRIAFVLGDLQGGFLAGVRFEAELSEVELEAVLGEA